MEGYDEDGTPTSDPSASSSSLRDAVARSYTDSRSCRRELGMLDSTSRIGSPCLTEACAPIASRMESPSLGCRMASLEPTDEACALVRLTMLASDIRSASLSNDSEYARAHSIASAGHESSSAVRRNRSRDVRKFRSAGATPVALALYVSS